MTKEEEESLVRALEVVDRDIIVKMLVGLVAGRHDVVQLPGGWRIRMDEKRRAEGQSIRIRL